MTFSSLVKLLETFGPMAIQMFPVLQKLYADIKAGKGMTEVTDADWNALIELGKYRSTDSLAAYGLKIVDGKAVPV